MMPFAFVGYSGSGKTTLILRLIRYFRERGEDVAVVKHTHHDANTERRGDTGRFLDAGAAETILASESGLAAHSSGVVFPWRDPRELVGKVRARRILLEGFRTSGIWPSILIDRAEVGRPPLEPERMLAVVSDRDLSLPVPRFHPDDWQSIGAFVDRMQTSMAARFAAIVFDLDGTLIDSYAALAQAINFARRGCGYPDVEEDVIRRSVGDGLETLLERTFAPDPVPPDARRLFEEHYDAICCDESRTLDDVEPTLAVLQGMGIRMGVCTNKPTRFSQKILDSLGLGARFSAVVGPDLAGSRKPDPEHVLFTLGQLGRGPAESLFVGDMTIDVAAARSAAVPVAVVPTGSSAREALEAAAPDFLLDRFSDLAAIARSGGG
ncbi:MAG TPA: molybdopterin-guanine dinucleotide biosynthesis protein MobB [Thermoanaerobaculia bacterium]